MEKMYVDLSLTSFKVSARAKYNFFFNSYITGLMTLLQKLIAIL
jgi:hypothetical protein